MISDLRNPRKQTSSPQRQRQIDNAIQDLQKGTADAFKKSMEYQKRISSLDVMQCNSELESRVVGCYWYLILGALLAPDDWYLQHGTAPDTIHQSQNTASCRDSTHPNLTVNLQDNQSQVIDTGNPASFDIPVTSPLANHVEAYIALIKYGHYMQVSRLLRTPGHQQTDTKQQNSSYRPDRVANVTHIPLFYKSCPKPIDMTFLSKFAKMHFQRLKDVSCLPNKKHPSVGGISKDEYHNAFGQFRHARKWALRKVCLGYLLRELQQQQ